MQPNEYKMNPIVYQEAVSLAERAKVAGEKGKTASPRELSALNSDMGGRIPDWYIELVTSVPICGLEFALNANDEDGVLIEWSDSNGMRGESLECYPGLAILERGFINIGGDPIGSGDSFFINGPEGGDDPPVFQVYHDISDEADEIIRRGLNLIAPSLSTLFREASFAD